MCHILFKPCLAPAYPAYSTLSTCIHAVVRCYLPCVPVLLYANLLRPCLRRICCKTSAIHVHADERAGCGGCKGSKRADQCFVSAVRNSQAFTTYLWAVDVRAEQVVAIEHVALGVLARTPFHSCLATCTRLTLHTTYVLLVRHVHFRLLHCLSAWVFAF